MTGMEVEIALLKQSQQMITDELKEIKEILAGFDNKLDRVMEQKADKTEVAEIKSVIRWVVYTIIGTIIVSAISLIFKL